MNTQYDSDPAELVEECEATVELYLTPEEVLTLARAAEQATSRAPPIAATQAPSTEASKSGASSANSMQTGWWSLLRNMGFVAIAMVFVALASAAYHAAGAPVAHTVSTHPPAPAATATNVSTSAAENIAALENTAQEPQSELVTFQPVRFPNPFDASEIFELPPGTSDADARESIATLLLERAHDRLLSLERLRRAARRHAALPKFAKRRARASPRFARQ